MNETETHDNTSFDEAADARAHLRIEEAIDTFTEASRAAITNPICPRCISPYGQWRGYRTRAKDAQTIHRRRCNTCTKWFSKETH
ncbi:MAG: hypothetical protein IT367_20435 [Candidatus Hydrogenedentes bacterium]|nr:hypothetical protein [Candidatus Hydrogenedentota bacterium]